MVVIDQNVMDASASAYQANIPENELNLEAMNNEILDLLPPKIHENTFKWIIFSDLHVKDSSIETCEQVLQHINDVAVEEKAGIIFLGDFWHVRGSLNVELLNRVLRSLMKWTQPVILIPGNHDQVQPYCTYDYRITHNY